MSLPPVAGHHELRERLRQAASRGRLSQSLLFYGPEGVGKQRLALWLGTLLLCEEETGCGRCRGCRLAGRLEHPDLHWFFPLARPGRASSPRKLREKLEEARLEELRARRERPLAPRGGEEATGIYLAAVREIRARASRRPAMGRRAIFVIGRAESMVPQAASPQAANAFLKLLEEPPADTFVILTSHRPGALLPTIRSRVLSVRVPALPDGEVASFLGRELDLPAGEAERAARLAQGAIGRALRLLDDAGSERREEAADLLRAALSPNHAHRLRLAARLSPSGARGGFTRVLDDLSVLLRDVLAVSLGNAGLAFDPDRATEIAGENAPAPHGVVLALERVAEARQAAAGNVNPQAIAAVLLAEMDSALTDGSV